MEKLAHLKIYETKYPKEKFDGSFTYFFLTAHPVLSCCCNLALKPSVISTGSAESLGAAHESPEGVCGEWDSYTSFHPVPAAAKQTSHKEFLQNQEEFFVIQVAMNRRKIAPERTFYLNSLSLWFGAEKPVLGCSGQRHENLLHLPCTVSAIFWESAACWKQLHLGFAPNVLRETHCALSLFLLLHLTI